MQCILYWFLCIHIFMQITVEEFRRGTSLWLPSSVLAVSGLIWNRVHFVAGSTYNRVTIVCKWFIVDRLHLIMQAGGWRAVYYHSEFLRWGKRGGQPNLSSIMKNNGEPITLSITNIWFTKYIIQKEVMEMRLSCLANSEQISLGLN